MFATSFVTGSGGPKSVLPQNRMRFVRPSLKAVAGSVAEKTWKTLPDHSTESTTGVNWAEPFSTSHQVQWVFALRPWSAIENDTGCEASRWLTSNRKVSGRG